MYEYLYVGMYVCMYRERDSSQNADMPPLRRHTLGYLWRLAAGVRPGALSKEFLIESRV